MDAARSPVRILAICTHNRTRSVMIQAMLQSMLDERLGAGRAQVRSAGFGPPDLPAIPDAVAAMRARGLDVTSHRSRQVTVAALDEADLVVTSERDHVVRAATMAPDAFPRSLTLPELLVRGSERWVDAPGVRAWAEMLTADRTTAHYLSQPVDEIADPTGTARRAFADAVDDIEVKCRKATGLIAGVAERAEP